VKCTNSLDPFIFDIVPSIANHQDYVRIVSSSGGPENIEDNAKLIASSATAPVIAPKKKRRIIENKAPELIESTDSLFLLKNKPTTEETQQPSKSEELRKELEK
jgi:hypothetical protein